MNSTVINMRMNKLEKWATSAGLWLSAIVIGAVAIS